MTQISVLLLETRRPKVLSGESLQNLREDTNISIIQPLRIMDSEPTMGPYGHVLSSTAFAHSRRPSRDSSPDWRSRIVTWGCKTRMSAAPLAHYPLSIGFLVPSMYIGVPWVPRRIATSLFLFFLSFSRFLRRFSLDLRFLVHVFNKGIEIYLASKTGRSRPRRHRPRRITKGPILLSPSLSSFFLHIISFFVQFDRDMWEGDCKQKGSLLDKIERKRKINLSDKEFFFCRVTFLEQ